MYLKALEMQGFKSFPDKIVLNFGKGVTAVVGPNGSGKSNISDAVRWVLGEQSTKSLRGSKMEDVIFSGTKDRRPQGFAEVTLKLDNIDSALNNPEKEVSVTRRYYRSGDSSYLINGSTVRLKDVHELFMDTGLGRDGYSMVGQGRIEEMVSAKSENRRDMLEEAAGISAFRYRRGDALKKLEQAEENLVRLRDIVTELQSRVGPLEKQSIKAQQFLVYAAEKKDLEIGLWVNILSRSSGQIREQGHKIEIARSQYESAGEALEQLSRDIDSAADGTRDINIRMEQIRNLRGRLEEQASQLDSKVMVCRNSIAHNNETAERIKRDMEAEDAEDSDIIREIEENEKLIEGLHYNIEKENNLLQTLSERLSGLKKSDEEYSEEYNSINAALSDIALRLSQTEIMISAASSSVAEIESRTKALDESISSRKSELLSVQAETQSLEKSVNDISDECESLANAVSGYELRLKKAEDRLENRKKDNEQLKLELLSKESRLKFLQDTEKNMEGYQGSVKAVLREYSRGTLTGIRGTLSNLIKVREEYQTAVETALGNAIQDIVTETENDAKKAINMLKNSSAGRATFLPLNAIKGRVLEEKGLDDHYGFVDLAYRLVDSHSDYEEIIKSLLGRIAVCEDLDCAIALAKKYNYKFKIVTLDGQVINAGGSMTGGSKINNAGFLARKTEIEKLVKECEAFADKVSFSFSELKNAAEVLAKEKADLEGSRGELLRAREEKLRLEGELSIRRNLSLTIDKDIKDAEEEKERAKERIAYFTENIRIGEEEKTVIIRQRSEKEEELQALTGGRDSLIKERERLNEEMAEVNMRTVSFVKEAEAKKEAVISLNKRKEAAAQRKDILAAEIEELNVKNRELENIAAATAEEAQGIRDEISRNEKETRELIRKREELEKSVTDKRSEEKVKSEEREKISGELIRLEEKKAYLEKEQQDIERKLFEEYSLTRREAEDCCPEIESVPKAQKRLSELKGQIKALGSVNVAAIDEYKEVLSRYEFLSSQVNDVEKSRKELLKMVEELTSKMAEQFRDRFDAINNGFKETFTALFGGGSAELVLEDENDILECNIEIKAQPPGKNVKSLTLLSGGEKGLTAIALLFAILKVRPAPFCIFDEVEAALDDVNVLRYAQYVRMMTDETQFVLITHRRGTMEEADMLYGVTMQEHGVSKLLELKTAEMVEKLKLDE
ncbi:MAG: chromosome segregation protein SMC [Ruminococcaceae bacterium]|nr:chromosome segregation protein SMC [Oscillospiraceae bacterium]